ncbi:hypothetical protein C9994_15760, partial [Marivirga lumbricoides]
KIHCAMKVTFSIIMLFLTTGFVKSITLQDSIKSQMIIKQILVKNVTLDNFDDSLIRGHGENKALVLDVKKNNDFVIEWEILNQDSIVQDSSYRYAFRLARYDRDWIFANHTTQTRYVNLCSGFYTFMVKYYENGYWNNNPTRQRILIIPKWWQTWWARLGQLGIVVTGRLILLI